MVKPLTRAEVRDYLKPYAQEIGHVTLAWNSLHENLALLFWFAMGHGPMPHVIWNKLSLDRLQRDILKTITEAGAFSSLRNGFGDDVLWLIKATDGIADARNIAVHAPLTTLTDLASGLTTVAPQDFFRNKRARRLKGRDIIRDLEWCAECIDMLNLFAADRVKTMGGAPDPWPGRPSLPPQPSHSQGRTKR